MTAPEGTGVLVFGPPSTATQKPTLRAALAREEQRSARVRSIAIMVLMSSALIIFFLMTVTGLLRGMDALQWWTIVVCVGAVIALEVGTLRTLAGVLARPVVLEARGIVLVFRFVLVTTEITLISFTMLPEIFTSPFPSVDLLGPATFVYLIFIVLSSLHLDVRLGAHTGFMAALQYGILAALAARHPSMDRVADLAATDPFFAEMAAATSPGSYFAKCAFLALAGLGAGFVGQTIQQAAQRALEKHYRDKNLREKFGQYLSPEVLNQVLAGTSAGATANVCVMFVDIREFTKFAEGRSASEVVEYLNRLFDALVTVVQDNHGWVAKFLGDGFMAVFGAPVADPKACWNAVEAARAMLLRVEQLNASGTIAATRIGIGIHTGPAVTGEVGAEERKEYTVIGDTVNLASRIESLNREFGSSLLVSDEVLREAGLAEPSGSQDRGMMQVKGRSAPVRVVQLV